MIKDEIKNRLAFLNSTLLILNDESKLHKGHSGNNGGSHFNIKIVSEKFSGKSRMERHRMIYEALGDLFPNTIHALSIKAITKEEEKE
ncbi:BolA family transcriptional regulator [Methylophilaceae bacterium]|jgi:BolA family transcriptional regulator, general stress-responsive regulator|nr:BolA family transcriptional regulator [Methylophilaceae bacterium]|tara:strand:- start:1654 stop:1917 length:264 start_codon:yes stop_codon:yes gene_type:complete